MPRKMHNVEVSHGRRIKQLNSISPRTEIERLPSGRWVVGVSGGADSIALLQLMAERRDLQLHVAHFNHETRPGENEAEARFLQSLCEEMKIPCTVGRLSETRAPETRGNRSARYRAARMAFFHGVVEGFDAQGVVLAHHADDQAETVLRRLLRGADPAALAGIQPTAVVDGLPVHHPLLNCRRSELRTYLREKGQAWCEDPSNQSDRYERNRLRAVLQKDERLLLQLLEIGRSAGAYRDWLSGVVPAAEDELEVGVVAELPGVVSRQYIRNWLLRLGCPANDIDGETIARVMEMAVDQSSPVRMHVAGGILLRRRKGKIARE